MAPLRVGDQAQAKAFAKQLGIAEILPGCQHAAFAQDGVDVQAAEAAEGAPFAVEIAGQGRPVAGSPQRSQAAAISSSR